MKGQQYDYQYKDSPPFKLDTNPAPIYLAYEIEAASHGKFLVNQLLTL